MLWYQLGHSLLITLNKLCHICQ